MIFTYVSYQPTRLYIQVNLIIYFILVCVVMVQVSYIPRCRVMLDLPNLSPGCVNHASPYTEVCDLYIIMYMHKLLPKPL